MLWTTEVSSCYIFTWKHATSLSLMCPLPPAPLLDPPGYPLRNSSTISQLELVCSEAHCISVPCDWKNKEQIDIRCTLSNLTAKKKKKGVGVRRGGSLAFFLALLIPAGACLPWARFMAVTEAAVLIHQLSALNEVKLDQREASCRSIYCKFWYCFFHIPPRWIIVCTVEPSFGALCLPGW